MHLADIDWSTFNPFKTDTNIKDILTAPINTSVLSKDAKSNPPNLDNWGTKQVQNTSDFTTNFSLSSALSPLALASNKSAGLIDTTSPAIPDFLKSATSLNTTTAQRTALLPLTTPWYQNQKTLLIAGGIAAVLAGLFVFTGNKT